MRRILVLGGSYFTGRLYVMRAAAEKDIQVHVVNRGRFPLNLPNVTEHYCNRRDRERLAELLAGMSFDSLIDFCAYVPEDIAAAVQVLDGQIGHYIYVSTASVYLPETNFPDENAAVRQKFEMSEVGEYIQYKLILEQELTACCGGTPWTIMRPAFIYGPYNYAPRESWLIRHMVQGIPVPYPKDATGRWSFVYAEDVAAAMELAAGNPAAYGKIFNLAAPEQVDYPTLFQALENCWEEHLTRREITCRQAEIEGIALPFPLEGTLCYDGSRIVRELKMDYTQLQKGIQQTIAAFRPVYEP